MNGVCLRDPRTISLDNIIGLIMNTPSPYELGMIRFPLSRRHWFAICRIGGVFYNLDSKLTSPAVIGEVS